MRVDFHSGVADKLVAACGFLHKAQAAGATVVVCGDPGTLDRLDSLLWTFDPLAFVPHLRVKGDATPPATSARTPTWLVDDLAASASREVLLNLGPAMAAGWETFDRVVEIVSADAVDATAGRERWRQYRGHADIELLHHQRSHAS